MTSDRQQEIELFKESILQTAQSIAAQKGWAHVSMRNIATELNVTAPLLYSYFKNKDIILRTLKNRGFKKLHKKLKAIRLEDKELDISMIEITEEIIRFVHENQEIYEVMFNLQGVKCRPAKKRILRKSVKNFYILLKNKTTDNQLAFDYAISVWSLIHGFIGSIITQQVDISRAEAEEQLKRLVYQFLNRL